MDRPEPPRRAPWHALLAPLPAEAVPRRTPAVPPEVLATAAGAAVRGWDSLVLELTAGESGLRILQVLLDASGKPVSASDHVLYRTPRASDTAVGVAVEQWSIGGSFQPDGRFLGTCWRVAGLEPPDGADPEWDMTPRAPSEAEIAALCALVGELLARDPVRGNA